MQTLLVLQDPVGAGAAGWSGGPDFTRYLLICGLLVFGIGLAGWALRRFLAGTLRVKAARRSLQVLDLLPLGGKRQLSVVRCYDRTFLLGLGEREVGLIAELDAAVKPASEPLPSEADRQAFVRALKQRLLASAAEPIAAERRSQPFAARRGAALGARGGLRG